MEFDQPVICHLELPVYLLGQVAASETRIKLAEKSFTLKESWYVPNCHVTIENSRNIVDVTYKCHRSVPMVKITNAKT